jgi:GDP/UDP-N,N'-diacetylbacillosamine 2-epimerase (hydrolysing)
MNIARRKICVVTGTRAEYGLLRLLIHGIQDSDVLDLQLIVTGMHLSPEFGLTVLEIEADGFRIDRKVEMLLSSDTPVGITKSMGLAMIGNFAWMRWPSCSPIYCLCSVIALRSLRQRLPP